MGKGRLGMELRIPWSHSDNGLELKTGRDIGPMPDLLSSDPSR